MYFRYYLARRPVVVVADPDMLRQIMVRDFSSFPNRMVRTFTSAGKCKPCINTWFQNKLWWVNHDRYLCLYSPLLHSVQTIRFATKPMSDCLLMLRNERWKRVRSILTPSFSAAKMKEVRYAPFNYQKGVGHDPNAPCTQDCLNWLLSVFLSTLSHTLSQE